MISRCYGNHSCHLDEHSTGSKSGRRRSSHCSQGDPISNLGEGSAHLYALETCPEVRKQDWTERLGCSAATPTASGVPLKEPVKLPELGQQGQAFVSSHHCALSPGKGVGLRQASLFNHQEGGPGRALSTVDTPSVGKECGSCTGDELTWMS